MPPLASVPHLPQDPVTMPTKIYYSNLSAVKWEPGEIQPLGVLDSYATIKKLKQYPWADAYFMDCGAFSVWKSGKTIDLDKYIAFCQEHKEHFTVYAALDVVGDHAGSFRNYMKMREAGLDPLPCYHFGEPMSVLWEYAKHTGYIALGGVAMTNMKVRSAFFREVFQHFPDPSKVGFHGFGVIDPLLLSGFPWKSVDATSVHLGARLGQIYSGRGWVRICKHDKAVYSNQISHENEVAALQAFAEALGGNWALACEWSKEGLKERCKISIAFFEDLAAKSPLTYKVTHPTFHLERK